MVTVTPKHIKVIQEYLNKNFNGRLVVDGDAGPATRRALIRSGIVTAQWPFPRQLAGAIQHICNASGGVSAGLVDGYWGPKTDRAFDALMLARRPDLIVSVDDDFVREDDPGLNIIPDWPRQVQVELKRFYGDVGTNQGKVQCPYPMKLAWDTSKTITKFSAHEKVVFNMERIFKNTLDHYGLARIQELGLDLFGGCLNVRAMRGGTRYSMHSWGIAVDMDPSRNRLKWDKSRAEMAKPEYAQFIDFWEQEGAVSLGRRSDRDWMHFQFAKF